MTKKKKIDTSLEFNVFLILDPYGDIMSPAWFRASVDSWLRKVSSACGRRKSHRALPYLEKAIDTVYSAIEAELHRKSKGATSAYSAEEVVKHPVWIIFVELVTKKFNGLVRVVKPHRTPTEAVRAKLINRTFSNLLVGKLNTFDAIKGNSLVAGDLGLIKVQILEAQVQTLIDAYNNHVTCDTDLWPVINSWYQRVSRDNSSLSFTTRESFSKSSDFEVAFNMSREIFEGHTVKLEKSWDFGAISNEINVAAQLGRGAKAKLSAHANLGSSGGAGYREKKLGEEAGGKLAKSAKNFKDSSDDSFNPTTLIPGIDLEIDAVLAAQAGLKVTVEHELCVGKLLSLTNEAELFAGATVTLQFQSAINSANMFVDDIINTKLQASAFAGVKATGTSTLTLKARGLNAMSASLSVSACAGVGANAKLEAIVKKSGDVNLTTGAGLVAGVGSNLEFGTMVNPMMLKVMLWDRFSHHLHSKQKQRIKGIRYNKRVNEVALARCNSLILNALESIDRDYNALKSELWRFPTYTAGKTYDGYDINHVSVSPANKAAVHDYLDALGVDDSVKLSEESIKQESMSIDKQARVDLHKRNISNASGGKNLVGGLASAGLFATNPFNVAHASASNGLVQAGLLALHPHRETYVP